MKLFKHIIVFSAIALSISQIPCNIREETMSWDSDYTQKNCLIVHSVTIIGQDVLLENITIIISVGETRFLHIKSQKTITINYLTTLNNQIDQQQDFIFLKANQIFMKHIIFRNNAVKQAIMFNILANDVVFSNFEAISNVIKNSNMLKFEGQYIRKQTYKEFLIKSNTFISSTFLQIQDSQFQYKEKKAIFLQLLDIKFEENIIPLDYTPEFLKQSLEKIFEPQLIIDSNTFHYLEFHNFTITGNKFDFQYFVCFIQINSPIKITNFYFDGNQLWPIIFKLFLYKSIYTPSIYVDKFTFGSTNIRNYSKIEVQFKQLFKIIMQSQEDKIYSKRLQDDISSYNEQLTRLQYPAQIFQLENMVLVTIKNSIFNFSNQQNQTLGILQSKANSLSGVIIISSCYFVGIICWIFREHIVKQYQKILLSLGFTSDQALLQRLIQKTTFGQNLILQISSLIIIQLKVILSTYIQQRYQNRVKQQLVTLFIIHKLLLVWKFIDKLIDGEQCQKLSKPFQFAYRCTFLHQLSKQICNDFDDESCLCNHYAINYYIQITLADNHFLLQLNNQFTQINKLLLYEIHSTQALISIQNAKNLTFQRTLIYNKQLSPNRLNQVLDIFGQGRIILSIIQFINGQSIFKDQNYLIKIPQSSQFLIEISNIYLLRQFGRQLLFAQLGNSSININNIFAIKIQCLYGMFMKLSGSSSLTGDTLLQSIQIKDSNISELIDIEQVRSLRLVKISVFQSRIQSFFSGHSLQLLEFYNILILDIIIKSDIPQFIQLNNLDYCCLENIILNKIVKIGQGSLFSVANNKIQNILNLRRIQLTNFKFLSQVVVFKLFSIQALSSLITTRQITNCTVLQLFKGSLKIKKSLFVNMINQYLNGSIIQSYSSSLKILNIFCIKIINKNYGGAIYFQDQSDKNMFIIDSYFSQISALYGGGIFHDSLKIPIIINCRVIKLTPNFIQGLANNVLITMQQNTSNTSIYVYSPYKHHLFQNIQPGESIILQIYYFYYNLDKSNIQCQINEASQINIRSLNDGVQEQEFAIYQDTYQLFTDQIQLIPKKIQSLVIQINQTIILKEKIKDLVIQFDFIYRPCISGELLVQNVCRQCIEGYYSNTINSLECFKCIDGGMCLNGKLVGIQQGYWRKNFHSNVTHICLYSISKCNEQKGQHCDLGYTGQLCETCDFFGHLSEFSYFRLEKYNCESCEKVGQNKIKIGFFAILYLMMIFLLCIVSKYGIIQMVAVEYLRYINLFKFGLTGLVQLSGIFIKILLNHVQILSVLQFYQYEGSIQFKSFLQQVANPSKVISLDTFSFDCAYKDLFADNIQLPFNIFWLYFSCLIAIHLIVTLVQCLLSYKNYKKVKLREIVFAFNYLFLFFNPDLSNSIFSLFSCRSIEGQYYLHIMMTIPCYTKHHLTTFFGLVFPLMLVWVSVPLVLALLAMIKKNKIVIFLSVEIKYGLFSIEYRKNVYYFEFIKIFQKMLVILIMNTLAQEINTKLSLIILLNLLYGILSNKLQPYLRRQVSKLDRLSVLVLNISLVLGILMFQVFSIQLQIAILLITLIINFLFFILILKSLLQQTIYEQRFVLHNLLLKVFTSMAEKQQIDPFKLWKKVRQDLSQIVEVKTPTVQRQPGVLFTELYFY